jgi:DNA-binding MarR family transcriptional regulator
LAPNLKLLGKNAFVRFEPDAASRARLVSLMEKGEQALTEATRFWLKAQTAVHENFFIEESATLRTFLRRLKAVDF